MTRETYLSMTSKTRAFCARLPGGAKSLLVPTLICAAAYAAAVLSAALSGNIRLLSSVIIVPAVCFLLCTILRPLIGRTRPYDAFNAEPVGTFRRGKGKSMPSRHTVSAAAIAIAAVRVFPCFPVLLCMLLLTALIAFLRIAAGQHYPSDVLAALALSAAVSLLLYPLF